MVRLNKFIADSGLASRRGADKLIEEGKVKVNNKPAVQGMAVNPKTDTVSVDGRIIEQAQKLIYVMFNKPKGCITSVKDDKGRKTVYDYLDFSERLFPVGRLDYDSEGLLILTNDGALTHSLTHPSREVGKTYLVKVEGEVPEHDLAALRKGIELDGKKTAKAKIILKEFKDKISKFEVTIFEGRNRQVRRMFEHIGKNVVFLKRIAIGELRLGGLSRGGHRFLTDKEVNYLKSL